VEALIVEMHNEDREFRSYAARVLLFMQDPGALAALEEARTDKDATVRMAARVGVRRLRRIPAETVPAAPATGQPK
jgi:HEAT repeat protein